MLLQRLGQPSRTILDWNSLIRWCLDPPQSSSRTLTRLSAQALISIIWSERNNRLHKEPPIQTTTGHSSSSPASSSVQWATVSVVYI
ncbi:unnamed protein product [Brassica rapa]|uniref:Uncharacterized protein n=1 Tax=Brassica campestris TaxID=3711 RepID=A0A3P5Z0B5_BRACM|nr:unnamed protein product [Brassica rapa]VDC66630.1 unnamed protein product [Brassica rapa]